MSRAERKILIFVETIITVRDNYLNAAYDL